MKTIESYITEKLHLKKSNISNLKRANPHEEMSFSDWLDYVKSIDCEFELENTRTGNHTFGIKNTKCPKFNIKRHGKFYRVSSIYLGDYDGKFDKNKELSYNNFWVENFDTKMDDNDKLRNYLFTANNAEILKAKLEYIIRISK